VETIEWRAASLAFVVLIGYACRLKTVMRITDSSRFQSSSDRDRVNKSIEFFPLRLFFELALQ
jgi:hypothetical protein